MATLGKPAISDVKNGDVRALTVAISNIRQRIESIEGSLGTIESTVTKSSSTGSTQFNTLRLQIIALQAELTTLENTVAGLVADGAQPQLATRVFMPHAPAAPAEPAESTTNQIAVRAFQPHVPLAPMRDLADATAQIASRAFAARGPSPQPSAPEDQTNQLAVRAFQPHVPLTQARDVADAGAVLVGQAFARRSAPPDHDNLTGLQGGATAEFYHLTAAEYAGLSGDNATRQLEARVFMPHVPLMPAALVDDAQAQISVRAFSRGPPLPSHGTLPDLQGGAANEFYHLTAAEYAGLSGDNATRILESQVFGA